MSGLNRGYKYTVTRANNKTGYGNTVNSHPIDIYDPVTGVLLFSCPSVLETVKKTGIAESTIYYHCKKNKNKYQDEWISYQNYVFVSAKPGVF